MKSVRGLSEITGEDWSHIARVLKTLELPELIQNYLNQNQHPAILKECHLRSLLELVRLHADVQLHRFREMIEVVPVFTHWPPLKNKQFESRISRW